MNSISNLCYLLDIVLLPFGRAAVEDKTACSQFSSLHMSICAFFRLGCVCAKAERSRILINLFFVFILSQPTEHLSLSPGDTKHRLCAVRSLFIQRTPVRFQRYYSTIYVNYYLLKKKKLLRRQQQWYNCTASRREELQRPSWAG